MNRRPLLAAFAIAGWLLGATPVPAGELPPFVDRVWRVADSPKAGSEQLYVFLSEGTLVVASSTGKPSLGRWRYEGGRFTMTEEGIERRVDIVAASDSELRLRIHDPGEGVQLRLVPAAAEPPSAKLAGTSWKLEKLGTDALLPGAAPTLEFPEAGRIAGRGSCNRYFADVELDGERLRIGAIGATKMACPDGVMEQERKFFSALENAERFELVDGALRVHFAGSAEPLCFRATAAAP